jgi:hypothetical protein
MSWLQLFSSFFIFIYDMWIRISLALLVLGLLLPMVALAQDETQVPTGPADLKATRRHDGATAVAVLQWVDRADNELGFEILRADNNQEFRVVGMVGANTTRYEDKIGKYITGAFTYKVRAFNQAGKSEESNVVSAWF